VQRQGRRLTLLPRLPARAGKQGPQVYRLRDAARSQRKPLPPANARGKERIMRSRKQAGQVLRIGDRWYVRYWGRRNIGGTSKRKRVTHPLGKATTRGKRPPADIVKEAERHMATVNSRTIPADRIVTICDFVERVYLPWIELHKRPSTVKGYRDI